MLSFLPVSGFALLILSLTLATSAATWVAHRRWGDVLTSRPAPERTMEVVHVQLPSDAFAAQESPAEKGQAPVADVEQGVHLVAERTLTVPYASRILALDNAEGTSCAWLCTVCLN